MLADAVVVADRSQRDEQRHGHHRRVQLGVPWISTRIPFENGFISEVLVERGYNTYCVGKWHLTPGEECNLAAYKGRWPLGRGFERFYGFLGGEANQWYPDLVQDNSQIDAPGTPEDGYHLSKDLADQAIGMIQAAKVIDPDKPFFMYLAPGCGHAPHQVFEEWADKYKGKFDQGYEAIREGILAQQKKLGLLPDDTELSPINPHGEPARTGPDGQPWPLLDTVRPWDSLSDDERRLFARMAEVFAGFVSYTDDQLGRVLDYLEESGQLDNTLVVVVSDNGASGEGGPNGSFNEWRFFNGVADTTESTLPHIDELGTPQSYNHYCTGWAWAFDTPFPYWKRWAGYEGGVADMCLVAWPKQIKPSDEVRHQYIHAVDVVPTVYDLLGIEPPAVIKGYTQSPIEGESFAAALTDPKAPGKETQFYTMLGQRSIYHDGWLACTVHPPISGWGKFELDEWELYDLEHDRSQSKNVADAEPEHASKRSRASGSTTPGSTTACRSTTAQHSSRCSPNVPMEHRTVSSTPTTRMSPMSPRQPVSRSTAARTPLLRASRSTPRTLKVCCMRMVASRVATASTSKTRSSATPSTGSGPSSTTSSPTPTSVPARTSSPPSSRPKVRAPIRPCPASPER